jgi:hypothetical protein
VVSGKAGEAAERGRSALREQVDQRSTQLGEQVRSGGDLLRQVADQARIQGNSQHATLAGKAAERLDGAGGYLVDADADELLGKVEELARRQPWLVAGAGLLIGLAAGRMLKASSADRYQRPQLPPARPASFQTTAAPRLSTEPATVPEYAPPPRLAGEDGMP